jgi:hypothetical protein
MKFVMQTATPMYNTYREIIFVLNLLLLNDKKATLVESDIFDPKGTITERGKAILSKVSQRYVSFMRGENPLSFPVRLPPEGTPKLTWPESGPDGNAISSDKRDRMTRLPFVPVMFEGDSINEYLRISEEAVESGGLGVGSIDEMVQSGNWLFPTQTGLQSRDGGFDSCFEDVGGGGLSQFRSRHEPPKWLLRDSLGPTSPKAKLTLQRSQNAKGIVFIYSRFIKSGALPLALALEANGYTAWGDRKSLLTDGIQDDLGRQCALCPRRERKHEGAGHKFTPAKYIIITGRANVSPNNTRAIQAARAKTNIDGREVKIIIGSQVASEGIDFRFVREIYVFDSWFHLNKMEQVLGRGIRTCSHSLMKEEERNCTIHLLVNKFDEDETETADLYMYRNAMSKAVRVGNVTRVLKRYALDCNLNRDAIIVTGLASQRHVDSQGNVREEVDINDTPFTNVCDWIETCDYTCAIREETDPEHYDMSTYDDYAVRWRESELRTAIRNLFKERKQPFFQMEDIREKLSAVPPKAVSGLLSEIINNKSFRIQMPTGKPGKMIDGYIVYRNGYYMFQPDYLADIRIPLALRVADVPVKRDSFEPTRIKVTPLPGAAAPEATEEAPPEAEAEHIVLDPVEGTLTAYWRTIKDWAISISKGEAPVEDLPEAVQKAISERYTGDAELRENDQLIMVNWLYEHIQTTDYGDKKPQYLRVLSEALLGMVWDESLKPSEQIELLSKETDPLATVTGKSAGQIVENGGTKAFRYIDTATGSIKYVCANKPCSDAVTAVFEGDKKDPLHGIQANSTNTGPIYGFMVPKGKEGRLVFKTNDRPVAAGTKPEKGGECSIVSTIALHIIMLKEIAGLMEKEGYPTFILVEKYLDEKILRKKQEEKAEEEAKRTGQKYEKSVSDITIRATSYAKKGKHPFKTRTFENAVRACALKDIILRWIDIMQKQKAGRRYFYRPIAALKSGHKGTK